GDAHRGDERRTQRLPRGRRVVPLRRQPARRQGPHQQPDAALLVARGVGLLVRALAPRRLAAQRHDPPPARQALRAPLIAAVGVAVVVGGAAAVVVAARGGDDVPAGTAGCNGAPALCERPVTEVVFPATHNSMSAADEGWFSAEHTGGIGAQLDSGIRGLLIDTWYGRPGSRGVATDFAASGVDRDDLVREYGPDAVAAVERVRGRLGFGRRNGRPADVYLCHIACEAGATRLEDVLVTVRRFLERERGAVLVIVVQDQVAPADVRRAFVRSGLRRYVLEERPAERWPTLARMIRTDQRVIVMNENRTDPDIPWMLPAFEVMEETPYDAATIGQLSCRPNRGGTRKPFFQLNHWVNDVPRSPRTAARINARDFLVDRARRCARERGSLPNLLAVNFYEEGDVTGAADRLNGLEAER
ncbi:MAG TPA: hypothetical protein VNT51_02210, partial [Miltoncostaeaceae bacterium]|nr:hypothetical protein [Miltoncostaeaceae bacterium]